MSIPAKVHLLFSTALLLLPFAFHTAAALSSSSSTVDEDLKPNPSTLAGGLPDWPWVARCSMFPAVNEKCDKAGVDHWSPEAKQNAFVAGEAALAKTGKSSLTLTETDCLTIVDAMLAVPHKSQTGGPSAQNGGPDAPHNDPDAQLPDELEKAMEHCQKFPAVLNKGMVSERTPKDQQAAIAAAEAAFKKIGKKPEELTETDCFAIVDAMLSSNEDCCRGCCCWIVVVVVLAVLLAAGALVLFLVLHLKKDQEEEGGSDSSVY